MRVNIFAAIPFPFRRRERVYPEPEYIAGQQAGAPYPYPDAEANMPPPSHEMQVGRGPAPASDPNAPDDRKKDDKPGFWNMLGHALGGLFEAIIGIFKAIGRMLGLVHDDPPENTQGQQQTPPPQNRAVLKDGPAAQPNAPAQSNPARPQGTVAGAGAAAGAPPSQPDPSFSAPPPISPNKQKPSPYIYPDAATKPAPAPTSSNYSTTDKLKIADAVNNLALVNFKDPNPIANSVSDADHQKLAGDLQKMQNIQFYNASTKQYESIKTGDPRELSAAIANDTDKRFRVDLGDGKAVYLEQVKQAIRGESPSGFAGASFKTVDAAGQPAGKEAWMGFPGYTGKLDIGAFQTTTDGTPQSNSMQAIAEGRLNPQAPEAIRLAAETLKAVGPETALLTAADSMGDSNMRVAGAFLKGNGLKVQEIALEPVADSAQVAKIDSALADPNSGLHRQFASYGIAEDKIAGLEQAARLGGIDMRSEFQRGGQSYLTAEAGVPIGRGLLPGMDLMNIANGARSEGAGNSATADTQLRLDITHEQYAKPELAGHTGVGIMQALMNKDVVHIQSAGLALQDANMTTAAGTTQQSLPAGPADRSEPRRLSF